MTLRLSQWLSRPQPPWWRQTLLYVPVTLVPAALLTTATYFFLQAFDIDPQPFSRRASALSPADIVGSVIFAPIVETLFLAALLSLLLMASQRVIFVAAMSALLWG